MKNAWRPWLALMVLCLGTFAILLDTTIVNVALPSIITGLHASLDQALWVINAYMLVFSSLLILAGRLGDLLGPRRMFAAGLALFAIASAVCGAAQSPDQLIAARVVQGGRGGRAVTTGHDDHPAGVPAGADGRRVRPVLLDDHPGGGQWADPGRATDHLPDLAVVFYVNLPIAAAGIALAFAFVPEVQAGRRHRLDVTGVALASAGRPLTWIHVATGEKMTWRIPFRVTGKIRRTGSPVAEGYAYAQDHASKPVKQTLPSPLLANWAWDTQALDGAYRDPFELLADTTALIRDHARELARAGCGYIQIDAPDVAGLADPARGETHPASGIPVARLLSDGLDLLDTVPDGITGVTFALHLCRGNIRSHYATSGGYERISRQVFTRLTRYQVFLLEYDDDRSGGFAPLADCPDDKTIVLGLISSKIGQMEDPASVAARVEQAAHYHPRDQLALSTQCGFATDLDGNQITHHHQQAKLALVGTLARQIWS